MSAWINRAVLAAAAILLVVPSARAGAVPEQVIGLRAMNYMETLPLLRDLVICRELSTHDKTGGNDNGFTNKAEFVRREFGPRVVVMDAAGPGCLMSFWYSWPNEPRMVTTLDPIWRVLLGKVRFFFDGGSKARLAVPLRDLVGAPPFTYPLTVTAAESTGGYISYVPMPFQDGLRVSIEGGAFPDFFYHLWYHSYPRGTRVASFTGNEDLSEIVRQWDPEVVEQPAGPLRKEVSSLTVAAGESKELAIFDRGGVILCIRMKAPDDDLALRSAWLSAFWDGREEPAVSAPLSLFFAVEHRFSNKQLTRPQSVDMHGLVVGRDREGLFYLRLPMPFAQGARLAIENKGNSPVTIKRAVIEYDDRVMPDLGTSAGYLGTQFRESSELTPGRDYVLAELEGRGHIVGTVLSVEDTPVNFLEGDERVYTDQGRSPLVMGDATETYFNGSWYFCGQAFACPIHGAPAFNVHNNGTDITMYRFHLTDLVPYRTHARFSIQHGAFNNVYGKYRSLVFYYGLPGPAMTKSDHVGMADDRDLVARGYKGPRLEPKWRDGFFEGDFNGQDLGTLEKPAGTSAAVWMVSMTVKGVFHRPPKDSPDRVRFPVTYISKPCEFKVRIDPDARAIMLRRLYDQSTRGQKAVIMVDGKPAATWFNAGKNRWKIWAEDDIILDPRTTAGKDRITIEVVPESMIFSAVEYSVFSISEPVHRDYAVSAGLAPHAQ